jgi:hypothetical protein
LLVLRGNIFGAGKLMNLKLFMEIGNLQDISGRKYVIILIENFGDLAIRYLRTHGFASYPHE